MKKPAKSKKLQKIQMEKMNFDKKPAFSPYRGCGSGSGRGCNNSDGNSGCPRGESGRGC